MPDALLEAHDIDVTFGFGPASFNAVNHANVYVKPGEAVGIVGESGSGKTTLARVLVGLQTPSAGHVLLEGNPIFGATVQRKFPRTERWKVQMVFQDPYSSLNPRQRAWEAVAEAVRAWQGLRGDEAKQEAVRLLRSMGISPEQAQQFPSALSGGQRQRVSVARALAPKPKILIADEPTSSIDQSAQAQLLNLLRQLQQEQGLAIVFISHDLGLVRYLTSRVYVMKKGDVVEQGDTVQVFDEPANAYTRLLIGSIPGQKVEAWIKASKEAAHDAAQEAPRTLLQMGGEIEMKPSTLAGRKPKAKRDGMVVVDTDVHAHELPATLKPYMEMPWRKSLEMLEQVPARYLDIPAFAPSLGAFPPTPPAAGARRMTVTSAKQMREDLDELGVDIGVLFPDHLLLHAAIKQDDYALALARAYNRWLVDEWLCEDNGLKGAILAPHHDPVVAAEEVRKYAGHRNVVAIYLPTSCVEPLYGHKRYDPLFQAAQETGLPVMFHSVTALHPVFPFNLQGYNTVFAAHSLAHPFSLIANLVSMMETGVPARFPGLKIAFTEGGVAWVPWIMMRLDKEYIERRRDVPWLTDRPSTYIRQMYFATQPIEEPEHLKDMATLLTLFGGEDSVMFASDWPHHDFDHPNKVLQIPVSDVVRRKLMGENAMRLLNLKVPVR